VKLPGTNGGRGTLLSGGGSFRMKQKTVANLHLFEWILALPSSAWEWNVFVDLDHVIRLYRVDKYDQSE